MHLRLMFENVDGIKQDITMPLTQWVTDWWYDCNCCPSNDTLIDAAILDGHNILDGKGTTFLDLAGKMDWDGLRNEFMQGQATKDGTAEPSAEAFMEWLEKRTAEEDFIQVTGTLKKQTASNAVQAEKKGLRHEHKGIHRNKECRWDSHSCL